MPAPAEPSPQEAAVLALRIGRAWRDLRRGASAVAVREYLLGKGESPVELGQIDSLDLLAGGPMRMSELAEKLRIEPSTATRSIERLVKAGLARRRPSAEDGRVVEVELTPEGRAIYKDVAVRRLKLIASALAGFEPAEREAFVGMLERYVGLVDRFVEEQAGA